MIDYLITCAINNGGWMELDRQYLQNKIKELVGKDLLPNETLSAKEAAEALAKNATENEGLQYILFNQLLDLLTPPPSVVNAYFAEHYHKSPEQATSYYHDLLKGIGFFETCYAKDAQDFLDFNAEGTLVSMNNRFIRMNLSEQAWGFQLLPIKEQEIGIIFPEYEAQYSTIKKVVGKMFEVVEVFPHYEVSMATAWLNTKPKTTIEGHDVSIQTKENSLIDLRVCQEALEILVESYNTDELIDVVKSVAYKDYRTVVVSREKNKFAVRILFKTKESMNNLIQQLSL